VGKADAGKADAGKAEVSEGGTVFDMEVSRHVRVLVETPAVLVPERCPDVLHFGFHLR
jgi:hypothetical protein